MRPLLVSFLGLAAVVSAQRITDSRMADIRGGGGDGKCTIEVEIDDIAEVEIQGNRAQIRTLAGSPARIVRFVCNQVMPNNPYDFRFRGIDGRGRQDLVREPGRGAAVIRIDDPKGGREGYTFDIFWRGGSGVGGGGGGSFDRPGGYGRPNTSPDRYDRPNTSPDRYDRPGGNQGGFNNGNSGWSREVNFRGRGDGEFRPNRGNIERLYDCWVTINRRGDVEVRFDTDRSFSLVLNGRVLRLDRGRIYADMNGNGIGGEMVIDLDSRDRVTNVTMVGAGRDRFDLRWRN